MSKPTLADLSPRYQAQAIAQLHGTPKPRTVRIEPAPFVEVRAKNRIRQNGAGLNKTEVAFWHYLKSRFMADGDTLFAQSLTLHLANGCRYTPDFILKRTARVQEGEADAVMVLAFEVKGFMREDAAVKLKVAARLYPWIKFNLATKRKGGGWDIQEVLP